MTDKILPKDKKKIQDLQKKYPKSLLIESIKSDAFKPSSERLQGTFLIWRFIEKSNSWIVAISSAEPLNQLGMEQIIQISDDGEANDKRKFSRSAKEKTKRIFLATEKLIDFVVSSTPMLIKLAESSPAVRRAILGAAAILSKKEQVTVGLFNREAHNGDRA